MSGLVTALAAVSAAIAVAAGAFGAHGASGRAAELLGTGAHYQLAHAVAAIALVRGHAKPAVLMVVGSLIFAGSLYALAAGAPRALGAVAPIGGAGMIAAWLWLAVQSALSRYAATSGSETDRST